MLDNRDALNQYLSEKKHVLTNKILTILLLYSITHCVRMNGNQFIVQ